MKCPLYSGSTPEILAFRAMTSYQIVGPFLPKPPNLKRNPIKLKTANKESLTKQFFKWLSSTHILMGIAIKVFLKCQAELSYQEN